MAQQKGISVEKATAPWKVVTDLPVSEPAEDQILVKSVYTAINPVDGYMHNGLMVESWPWTPGCDAGGVVIKAGSKAVSPLGNTFKPGDRVAGCTRLGQPGYGTFQETFLMDAAVTLPIEGLSLKHACTLGVASYTAGLGIFKELKVPLPQGGYPADTNEWVVVFGGASSVGKATVQILKSLGFKVIATGSTSSSEVIKRYGADEVVNYKQPEEKIIEEIQTKTGGQFLKVFDATAQSLSTGASLLKSSGGKGTLTSTNDWTPLETGGDFTFAPIELGPVGRSSAPDINQAINAFIPYLVKLIQDNKLWPAETAEVGSGGFEDVIAAYAYQTAGKGGNKKVVVKLADE